MAIDSVVGLTREGMPLYSYIHPNVIKDSKWNNQMIYMVQDYLFNATQEYLRHNTIPGCTDSSATNYFHRANVAGTNVCKNYRIKVGWTMDGYFQKCEYVESYSDAHQNLTHGNQCEKYNHPHHLSKDYKCVDEDLTLGTIDFYVTYKHRVYNVKINGCNSSECSKNFTITDRIKVTTTICNNFVSYNTRMFGGIFQNDDNVFAENKRCAQGYDEYPIFLDHKICLASISPGMDMSQYLKATSLGFLGFRSCNDDIKCPYEAAPYYLTTINNCAYYYCVNIIAVPSVSYYDTLHPSVNRPPFIDRHLAFEMTRRKYKHVINESKDKAAKKMFNEDGEEVGEIVN
uniref:Uncharacterized protein n=1 Tax=Panagrolaimus sp. ES5 TaxID=591445 RepID=A0AC34F1T1_9BILA